MFSLKFQSAPGSIGQVREAATQLLFTAKGQNVPTFLVGHVTKDGSLAGPKALEHVVDTVLYFEGERHHSHRVVRAVKNRFGAVSELGVFEMTSGGLRAGAEPVEAVSRRAADQRARVGGALLGRRVAADSGRSAGARQHAAPTAPRGGWPAASIQQRLSLLLAVLEKRAGLNLVGDDVFVNIAGGMTVDEPASDLGVLAAIASSVRNRVDPGDHRDVRRGRAGRRGPRHHPGAAARARGGADGVPPLHHAGGQHRPGRPGRRRSACELVGVRTVGEALDEFFS